MTCSKKQAGSFLTMPRARQILSLRTTSRLRKAISMRSVRTLRQAKMDLSIFACLKVLTERIDMAFRNLDVVLKDNICLALGIVKKLPACFFEQVIDLDSGFGFFAHRFPWQVLCPLSKASIPQKPEVAPISPKMAVICKATSIMNMTPKSCFGIA